MFYVRTPFELNFVFQSPSPTTQVSFISYMLLPITEPLPVLSLGGTAGNHPLLSTAELLDNVSVTFFICNMLGPPFYKHACVAPWRTIRVSLRFGEGSTTVILYGCRGSSMSSRKMSLLVQSCNVAAVQTPMTAPVSSSPCYTLYETSSKFANKCTFNRELLRILASVLVMFLLHSYLTLHNISYNVLSNLYRGLRPQLW